ncbi:hypothetical protein RM96_23015 [Cupriavidus sp. IDO]|nr:hypothetical protein RM96_23015 [Cupriavidus sp. IDO]
MRLIAHAQRDTGQSRRVADFLLVWWNAVACGGVGLTNLWNVDGDIAADMVTVFAYLAAGPKAQLHRLFPQLAPIARQPAAMAREPHAAVAFAAQSRTQVDHQFDGIEPVGLPPPLVALDRNTGRIDDITLDASHLQGALNPEGVLACLVANHQAHVSRQRSLLLVMFNYVQHRLQARGGLQLGYPLQRHPSTIARSRPAVCFITPPH